MHIACMNKQIHVRDFDKAVHTQLVQNAKAKDMTLSEYVRVTLTEIANQSSNEALFERLKTREPMNLKPSAAEIIREDRDTRR